MDFLILKVLISPFVAAEEVKQRPACSL